MWLQNHGRWVIDLKSQVPLIVYTKNTIQKSKIEISRWSTLLKLY
jgi:hypothetical protein